MSTTRTCRRRRRRHCVLFSFLDRFGENESSREKGLSFCDLDVLGIIRFMCYITDGVLREYEDASRSQDDLSHYAEREESLFCETCRLALSSR